MKPKDYLKIEYLATIIIFVLVIYNNFKMSVWFIGCLVLLFNILNLKPLSKNHNEEWVYRLNKWRMNANALLMILLIIYGVIYEELLFLILGCLGFIVSLYNIANYHK